MQSCSKVLDIELQLTRASTPASPIASRQFLQGRSDLLADIRRAWARGGASVALYGQRGVGKTSVVKVASSAFRGQVFYHSASAGDSFESIASAMLDHFTRSLSGGSTLRWAPKTESSLTDNGIPERAITAQRVARCLPAIPTLLIIDDFERIQDRETKRVFADLIKKISDVRVPARLTFVGIGDHIRDLIEDHQSVSRQVVEVEVPQLSSEDIHELILRGAKVLGIGFERAAVDQIERPSENLPFRAHLLSEGAVHGLLTAIRDGVKSEPVVGVDEVHAALEYARKSGQYSIEEPAVPDRLPWTGDRDQRPTTGATPTRNIDGAQPQVVDPAG